MSSGKIGIWLVGAWGGVSTTVAVGLSSLQKNLSAETGLVSALPQFAQCDLATWDQFIIGGHEVRATNYATEANVLFEQSRVFSAHLLEQVAPTLLSFDKNIKPGTLINVGDTIESFAADDAKSHRGETPSVALQRIEADLNTFRNEHDLGQVIVVNLSSTEPGMTEDASGLSWQEVATRLEKNANTTLLASSLYAVAAMRAHCAYVNFTPSVGSDLPCLKELALEQKVLHAGRDGKTGETLLKSVLAPMFAARNLQVMSWVGHNIFGNMDGKVLDDPINKATKVHSKDHLLTEIFGYQPQSLVSIEYIESLGDWKTAWDHIHFNGFLNTPMTLQLTWQGCDSLLAAPLVLDLVRFTEREQRRGGKGVMKHLASFFKSPMDAESPEFAHQFQKLGEWATDVAKKAN